MDPSSNEHRFPSECCTEIYISGYVAPMGWHRISTLVLFPSLQKTLQPNTQTVRDMPRSKERIKIPCMQDTCRLDLFSSTEQHHTYAYTKLRPEALMIQTAHHVYRLKFLVYCPGIPGQYGSPNLLLVFSFLISLAWALSSCFRPCLSFGPREYITLDLVAQVRDVQHALRDIDRKGYVMSDAPKRGKYHPGGRSNFYVSYSYHDHRLLLCSYTMSLRSLPTISVLTMFQRWAISYRLLLDLRLGSVQL